jgi:hypothetical protein
VSKQRTEKLHSPHTINGVDATGTGFADALWVQLVRPLDEMGMGV